MCVACGVGVGSLCVSAMSIVAGCVGFLGAIVVTTQDYWRWASFSNITAATFGAQWLVTWCITGQFSIPLR